MSPIYFKAGDPIFEGINDQYCPGEDNITISGGFAEVEGAELYKNMPQCSDSFFSSGVEDNGRGCCKVEDVNTKCRDYTGNVNYDMGLKIIDPTSKNKYDVCLSLPFREKLPDFKNFIKLIIQILIALIITAITATCLEFWLKYGNLSRNFYYESNCARHNITDSYYNKNIKAFQEIEDNKPYLDNEISLIDFMFPKRLTFYPYPLPVGQEKQIGGGKWQSADKDKLGRSQPNKKSKDDCKVGFPYNLIKMTNNEHFPTFLKIPIKCFSLFFLFSMYLARKPINLIYRKTSDYYQNYIEGKDIRSNIIYFILLWLVFIPLVFIILLGQLIISIFGPIYNIIIQIILNFSSPKKFINLFSIEDDFKHKVDKSIKDGFDVGNEEEKKQITEYYKIINLKTIKDLLIPLFVNYKEIEPNKISNKKKQEYKKAGFAFCAYIALLILSIVKYITGGDTSNFDPSNLGEEDIPDFETSADNVNMDTLKSGGRWLGSIIISSIVVFILLVLFIFGAIFAARAGQKKREDGSHAVARTAAATATAMVALGGSNLMERAKAETMRAKRDTFNKMGKIKNDSVNYVKENPDNIQTKLLNAKRFFWSFPIKMLQIVIFVFYLLICIMLFGGLGNLMASMWFVISKLVYFFYIPLSNFKKFLNIIKQHGNLLTIMLCLNVIVGSGVYLDKAVTSIMSLILSVIVVYKCYMYFNQY